MTEPDQIEFHERVNGSGGRPDARSIPVRVGIVAGSAILVLVGAVAAMGASPSPSATGGQAELPVAAAPETGAFAGPPPNGGFRGGDFGRGGFGRGGFHAITISAVNGSSLSLETDDGWTRTIAVGASTAITRGAQTIAVGDLAVGDQIRLRQEKASDGSYTITAITVVLPTIAGEVTAVGGSTITVTGKDGTTATIHVDGDTTYEINRTAGKALSDITVGAFVAAEGTLRTDGSLDADAIHGGLRGPRDGHRGGPGFGGPGFGGPGFPDGQADPSANPAPTPASTAS